MPLINWTCGECETTNDGAISQCEVCDQWLPVVEYFAFDESAFFAKKDNVVTWAVKHSDDVFITPLGPVAKQGSVGFSTSEKLEDLELTAKNKVGTISSRLVIELPVPEVTDFISNRKEVSSGNRAQLKWSTNNATEVRILPDIGVVGNEGSIDVIITESVEYQIVASNPQKKSTKQVRIGLSPPSITVFEYSTIGDKPKEEITVNWKVTNATKVLLVIEGVELPVEVVGKHTFVPTNSGQVELICSNSEVEVSEVCLIEDFSPKIKSLKTDKSVVPKGGLVSVAWEVDKAVAVEISGETIYSSSGAYAVTINDDKGINFKVIGDYGASKTSHLPVELATFSKLDLLGGESKNYRIKWESVGLSEVRISGLDKKLSGAGVVAVPPISRETTFVITGLTRYGDEVQKEITVPFCEISEFDVSSKVVYTGRRIKINWSVKNAVAVFIRGVSERLPVSGELLYTIKPDDTSIVLEALGKCNYTYTKVELTHIEMPVPERRDFGLKQANLKLPDFEPLRLSLGNRISFKPPERIFTSRNFRAVDLDNSKVSSPKTKRVSPSTKESSKDALIKVRSKFFEKIK